MKEKDIEENIIDFNAVIDEQFQENISICKSWKSSFMAIYACKPGKDFEEKNEDMLKKFIDALEINQDVNEIYDFEKSLK